MGHISWKPEQDGNGYQLFLNDKQAAAVLPFADSRFAVDDTFAYVRDGVLKWTRTFTYVAETAEACTLSMDIVTAYEPEYYMIPAVTYNGNGWGSGLEPKGLERDGQPWVYAWHRTAVAGATYSEGSGIALSMFSEPVADMLQGYSCALAPGANALTHRLIWPEQETPAVYISRDEYGEAYAAAKVFTPGETFTACAYVTLAAYNEPRFAWRQMLDEAWRMFQQVEQPRFDAARIWELGMTYAKEGLWAEDGHFRGFAIGLKWDEGEWKQARHYEIGWCGQNASYANSMLADYVRFGNEDSLQRGLAVFDCWTADGRLPNGLIHCHYDYALFKQGQHEVQDACNLGTAALNLFEAEQWLERCGVKRPAYRETALAICNFALSAQSADGRIGKSWTNDGKPHDSEGTVGCFLVTPLAKAYELTGNPAYLHGAELGYQYYMQELLDNGYTTAGALDTYCVDKESAIPLLKAGIALYRITDNEIYLEWAKQAAWYLASWQWHHTVPYGADTALGEMNYNTFGGTSVSTQHHHIDPYALAFVEDWIELANITGNEIWRERAYAAWTNATIGISDGHLSVMGKPRPAGSQDEAFFHTRWGNPFNVSQWLVAWPTAFRLEVLRRVDKQQLGL
jgi:hypothetical protein